MNLNVSNKSLGKNVSFSHLVLAQNDQTKNVMTEFQQRDPYSYQNQHNEFEKLNSIPDRTFTVYADLDRNYIPCFYIKDSFNSKPEKEISVSMKDIYGMKYIPVTADEIVKKSDKNLPFSCCHGKGIKIGDEKTYEKIEEFVQKNNNFKTKLAQLNRLKDRELTLYYGKDFRNPDSEEKLYITDSKQPEYRRQEKQLELNFKNLNREFNVQKILGALEYRLLTP